MIQNGFCVPQVLSRNEAFHKFHSIAASLFWFSLDSIKRDALRQFNGIINQTGHRAEH